MKKLKLFFALFAMLALGVGNAWGETVFSDDFANVGTGSNTSISSRTGWSGFTNCYAQYNTGLRLGSSKNTGTITKTAMTGISGTTTLTVTFYLAKYNSDSGKMNITVSGGGTASTTQFTPAGNAGVTSTTSKANWEDKYKCTFTITDATSATTIKFATSSKRLILGPITIEDASSTDEPGSGETVLSVSPEKVDFGTKNIYFDSEKKGSLEIDIIGQNLTGNVSAAISEDTDDIFDLSQESFIPNTGEVSEKLTVSYEVSEARDYTATLTLSSDGVEDIELPITLKVINEEPATYVKVTNAVTDGEYLIVYEEGNVAFNGSLTTLDAVSNTVAIEINNNIIVGNTEIDAATFTIDATEGTVKSASGNYIGVTSYGNGLKQSTDASTYGKHSFVISEGNAIVKLSNDSWDGDMILNYNSDANQTRFRYYKNGGQKDIALYKKVDPNEIIEPQFKLAAGEYYGTQSVEITCATADAKIYYTLNGTDPTSASTEYTGAISITSTTTVKAIAVKGENSSAVVSATYTILAPLATMQAIFDKATDATQSVHIKFNDWVISGVVPGKDGKPSSNAYITDGSKGFIIYNKDGHGFNVGNKLSGTVVCDLTRYNGSAEVVGLTSSTEGLTVSTGGVVTPVVVNDVTTLSGVNTGAVIKITGVCETKNINSRDYFYVDGVQLYNSLFAYENPTVGSKYNVTGVYVQYNDVPEVLPRSAADIEEIIDLPTATISIANITMEVGKTKTIEATITPDAAQYTVQYAITAGNEYITLNGTTITAVAAGTATITATIAEVAGEYYGATKTFKVTVNAPNIAELPFEFTDGKEEVSTTKGMSQEGLGSDYTTGVTTKLKFDGKGDWVIIHFNSQAEKLTYDIKGNSFSGGKFTVQQSADGSTYTDVVTHTELGEAATKEHTLAAESRYVKFIYTEKSSGNVGLGNITISKADLRQETGLAWNPATVSLTVGDAFTAPTLSNPNSLTVDFESDNTALATVTASGIVSLNTGVSGKAVIKATYAGDATYKATEVTCVITVSPKSEKVVILAQHAGQWYAMTGAYVTDKTNVLAAIPVEYINGTLYNVADADKSSIEWQRSMNGNKATFKNKEGNYLTGGASGTALTLKADAFEWDYNGVNYLSGNETTKRTFLYCENTLNNVFGFKNFAITNAGSVKNNSDGTTESYSSTPEVVAPVYAIATIYTREDLTVDNHGTICLPYGSSNYSGAEFYEVSSLEVGKGLWLDQLAAGASLEAGKPYIFKATAAKIAVAYEGAKQESPVAGVNGLTGTFTDIEANDVLVGNYIIAENQIWVAGEGATLPANRAYINATLVPKKVQPEIPGRRRVCMGENAATGFDNIVAPEGQAVKAIVNGQLIIIRDGVKYNVQGQKL